MALEDLLISSDAPLDKVIYQLEHSVTLAPFAFSDDIIPHGLNFTPLLNCQWSTTPTFADSYNISGGPLAGGERSYNTSIGANGTNVYISTFNRTASPVTLYFRAYGLMPSDVNEEAPFTNFSGDNFVINSNFNYTKLLLSGVEYLPANSGGLSISHGLGYVPQVSCWISLGASDEVSPFVFHFVSGTSYSIHVDEQQLSLISDASIDTTMHYRIYADRQTA